MNNDNSPMDEEPRESSELRKRFIWKWHPHGWLTAILILIIVFLLIAFAE